MKFNIARPTDEDLKAAAEFFNMMRLVESGYHPSKVDEFDEPEFMDDKDKAEVLDALCEKFGECDLLLLLVVLETLLSPNNGIIDQDSDVLAFHPRLRLAGVEVIKSES